MPACERKGLVVERIQGRLVSPRERVDDNLIDDIDAAVAADIRRYEALAEEVFRPVRDLLQRAQAHLGTKEVDAAVSTIFVGVRFEARRFVWATIAENIDGLGSRLVLANIKALYALRKSERQLWSFTDRHPWIRKIGKGRSRAKLLTVPPTHHPSRDDVLSANEDIEEFIRADQDAQATLSRFMGIAAVERRRNARRILMANITVIAQFLGLQVVAFALATSSVGVVANLAFSVVPVWGSLAAALASATLVTLLVRPFLRRRLHQRLLQAAKNLFVEWVLIHSWISINRVTQWRRAVGDVDEEVLDEWNALDRR